MCSLCGNVLGQIFSFPIDNLENSLNNRPVKKHLPSRLEKRLEKTNIWDIRDKKFVKFKANLDAILSNLELRLPDHLYSEILSEIQSKLKLGKFVYEPLIMVVLYRKLTAHGFYINPKYLREILPNKSFKSLFNGYMFNPKLGKQPHNPIKLAQNILIRDEKFKALKSLNEVKKLGFSNPRILAGLADFYANEGRKSITKCLSEYKIYTKQVASKKNEIKKFVGIF